MFRESEILPRRKNIMRKIKKHAKTESFNTFAKKYLTLSFSFFAYISATIFIKAVPKTAEKTPIIEDKERRALKVP